MKMLVRCRHIIASLLAAIICILAWKTLWVSLHSFQEREQNKPSSASKIIRDPLPPNEAYDNLSSFVIFIGYPRSGHSLVGSLLDAHPNVIIAHEYHILWQWDKIYQPYQRNKYHIYDELMKNSRNEVENGYRSPKKPFFYTYYVPGQWQGRFNKTLKVIGTKKGGATTESLGHKHYHEVLDLVRKTLKVPFKFIHVVRNPYDDIATLLLRSACKRETMTKNYVLDKTIKLQQQIERYSNMVRINQRLLDQYGKDVLTLRSIDVIKKPRETLMEMCKFLGLSCSQKYYDDCASMIYKKASKTRNNVVWLDVQKREVQKLIDEHSFLNEFTFYSD